MLFDDESGGSVIGGDIDRLKEMDIEDFLMQVKTFYFSERIGPFQYVFLFGQRFI